MPPYVFFSLIAALGFAVSGIINKFASKYAITSRWPLLFWYYFTFIPFILVVPFLAKVSLPESFSQWVFIFGYSLFFLLGNICFFTAIFRLDASTFAPFFQLQGAFLAVLAFLFLGERFSASHYMWIAVILLGAVLVSIDEKVTWRAFMRPEIFLIFLMQLFHASSNVFAGFTLQFTDFWNLMFWPTLTSMLLVFIFTFAVNGLNVSVRWKQLQPLFLTNAVTFVAALSLFRAFEENITITGMLSLLTGPITFLIAVVLSKVKPELLEHHTAKVYALRGVGVAITLFGAVMLSK